MRDSLKLEAYKELKVTLYNRGLQLMKNINYSKNDFKDLVRELTLINQDIDDVNNEIKKLQDLVNEHSFAADDIPF